MGKLATFLALDASDRRASLEALWQLALAQFRVRTIPPRRWRDSFAHHSGPAGSETLDRDHLGQVRRVRLAVARAAHNLPTRPNCLPQALAARAMLERRGIGSALYIGTARDEDGVARFHAWLKVGEEWVTGLCDESRFALLLPRAPEPA